MEYSPFTALHTDPKIEALRQRVGNLYGKTPFLLMPVRIETRFVEAPQLANQTPAGPAEELYQQLVEASAFMRSRNASPANNTVASALIAKARNMADSVSSVNGYKKRWLSNQARLMYSFARYGEYNSLFSNITEVVQKIKALSLGGGQFNENITQIERDAGELVQLWRIVSSIESEQINENWAMGALESTQSSLKEKTSTLSQENEIGWDQLGDLQALLWALEQEAAQSREKLPQRKEELSTELYKKWELSLKDFAENLEPQLSGLIKNAEEKILAKQFSYQAWFSPDERIGPRLLVRIFPDDIAIDNHEDALSPGEVIAGQDFWKEVWYASGEESMELAAWRGLTAELGPTRAAWVRRQLSPIGVEGNEAFSEKPSLKVVNAIQRIDTLLKALSLIDEEFDVNNLKESSLSYNKELNQKKATIRRGYTSLDFVRSQLQEVEVEQELLAAKVIKLLKTMAPRLSLLESKYQESGQGSQAELDFIPKLIASHTRTLSQIEQIRQVVKEDFARLHPFSFHFPSPALRKEEWQSSPHTYMLPDRFIVLTQQGGQWIHIKVGERVQRPLAVGLNFSPDTEEEPFQFDDAGNITFGEEVAWMFDFAWAEQVGMGISLPVSDKDAKEGFDKVMVFGMRGTSSSEGSRLLEKLLLNHQYAPDGMAILPIGTPTNNTEEEDAGFRSEEEDEKRAYTTFATPLFSKEDAPFQISDGQRLARGLGVHPSVFHHTQGADAQEISKAIAMHHALWYGTGETSFSRHLDHVFNVDNQKRIRNYFLDNCIARGALPSLRIGQQPYGILATTAFSRFEAVRNNELKRIPNEELLSHTIGYLLQDFVLEDRFELRLYQALWKLQGLWSGIRKEKVAHAGNGSGEQHFLNIMGLHPTSTSFPLRGLHWLLYSLQLLNPNYLEDFFEDKPNISPESFVREFEALLQEGKYSSGPTAELLADGKPLKAIHYLNTAFQMPYPDIEAQEADLIFREEGHLLSDGGVFYFTALGSDPQTLYNYMYGDSDDALSKKSVLELLLTQSLFYAYQETALNILEEAEGILPRSLREHLKTAPVVEIGKYSSGIIMNFAARDLIIKPFPELEIHQELYPRMGTLSTDNAFYRYLMDNQIVMGNYLYKGELFNEKHKPFFEELKRTKEAIRRLIHVPAKELEQMMAEHLDAMNYRLDTWLLGLANKRLNENRRTGYNGVYLGAYGWVENLKRNEVGKAELKDIPIGLVQEGEALYKGSKKDGFLHMPSLNHAIAAAVLRAGYNAGQDGKQLSHNMAVNLSASRVRKALQVVDNLRNGLRLNTILGYLLERGLHERYREIELDFYIHQLRRQFPLIPSIDKPEEEPAGGQVLDGLALLEELRQFFGEAYTNQNKTFQNVLEEQSSFQLPEKMARALGSEARADSPVLKAIIQEVDHMADAFDALGDLALAENVYQVAQGNYTRAGAVLQAAAGEGSWPEFQILHPPRKGRVVTQRVVLNLKSHNFDLPDWEMPWTTRAKAEPALNHWLGQMMGHPAQIRCVVEYLAPGEPAREAVVDLSALPYHPLDWYYLLAEGYSSEMTEVITYHLRREKSLPDAARIVLRPRRRLTKWDPEAKNLEEITLLVKQIHAMLANSKAANAIDLMLPYDNLSNPYYRPSESASGSQMAPLMITMKEENRESLRLFVNGYDDSVWTYELPDSGSGHWFKLGGGVRASLGMAIQLASDRLFFIACRTGDQQLLLTSWLRKARKWHYWYPLSDNELGPVGLPSTALHLGQSISVFVIGQDGGVLHRKREKWSQWEAWENLGGQIFPGSEAAAVESSLDRIDLFIRDQANQLLHRYRKNGAWGAWETLHNDCRSSPITIPQGEKAFSLQYLGADGVIRHHSWREGAWQEPVRLEGLNLPEGMQWATTASGDKLHVMVRSPEGALRYNHFGNGQWQGWKKLDVEAASQPGLCTWSNGRIDTAAWSVAGEIMHSTWDEERMTWGNWSILEGENKGNIAIEELEKRVSESEHAFDDAFARIEQEIAHFELPSPLDTALINWEDIVFQPVRITSMQAALEEAMKAGLPQTVPKIAQAFTQKSSVEEVQLAGKRLVQQHINLLESMVKKQEEKETLRQEYRQAVSVEAKARALVEIHQALFGKGFVTLPQFRAFNNEQVGKSVSRSELLRASNKNNGTIMQEWVQSIAEVRPRMNALENIESLLELYGQPGLGLRPAQLPHRMPEGKLGGELITEEDYWLGIPYPSTYEPPEDKLSIVAVNWRLLRNNRYQNKVGMVLDEWVEVIPDKVTGTGVALHNNQPDARPPQSLLLAVSPKLEGNWELDDLIQTLSDTLEIAKNRAVEPDQLKESVLGYVLPATTIFSKLPI